MEEDKDYKALLTETISKYEDLRKITPNAFLASKIDEMLTYFRKKQEEQPGSSEKQPSIH